MNHYQGQSTSCHVFPHSSFLPLPLPRPSGMENGILSLAQQKPVAQTLKLLPYRTPESGVD